MTTRNQPPKVIAAFMTTVAACALAGILWLIFAISMAEAEVGGVARDGCHKHADQPFRHYPGTKVPHGECFNVAGETVKVPYTVIELIRETGRPDCVDKVGNFYEKWADQYASWKTTAHAARTAIRCLTNE